MKNQSAIIVMGNLSHGFWMDGISTMSRLADLHLPKGITNFEIIIEEEGIDCIQSDFLDLRFT